MGYAMRVGTLPYGIAEIPIGVQEDELWVLGSLES